jgi:DnaJ domain
VIYLLAAAAILVFIVWGSAGRRLSRFANWRGASGVSAIGALTGGGVLVIRGDWIVGIGLGLVGAWLALVARWPRLASRAQAPETMSLDEARAILGVGPGASAAEISEAYRRQMRRVHPDQGGTSGLAAQLNAARERLSRP